jgi:glutamyl-Q tRNA(Asp) synthetase
MIELSAATRGSRPDAVLRFAPSPTGRLHLGHAYSALLNQAIARHLGGRLLIRIEDTDRTRCRPEYVEAILDDLAWLGIRSDGVVRVQSEHGDAYRQALADLEARGLLYPCFATRQQIAAAATPGLVDPDGAPLYPGLCRGLDPEVARRRIAAGEPHALRLDMAVAIAAAGDDITYTGLGPSLSPFSVTACPSRWGDVVLQRKETAASYHIAVVVDDALQGITHVVRGQDLAASTDIHRLLQVLLGLPAPLYLHHLLIVDQQGRKLSKRDGDTGLATLRAGGATPADIRRLVGIPDTGADS